MRPAGRGPFAQPKVGWASPGTAWGQVQSDLIATDGFQMRLLEQDQKAARVEITDRRFYPEDLKITFTK